MKLCHARTACMRAVLAQQAEAYQRWGPDRATKNWHVVWPWGRYDRIYISWFSFFFMKEKHKFPHCLVSRGFLLSGNVNVYE